MTKETRDGAEGADDGCPNCGSPAPNHNFGCFRAPPKPAPDVMLEALLAARPSIEGCIASCIEEVAAAPYKAILAQIDAALYATASPDLGPPLCELCGQRMPDSEQMFRYHGHSGPCPSPSKTFYDEGWSARCEGAAFESKAANAWKEGWRDCDQVTPDERESGRIALGTLRPVCAPVPPADGATVLLEQLQKTISDEWGSYLCYRDQVGKKICTENRCRCADIARAVLANHHLSPSPAVAAEPVASDHSTECRLCGEMLHDDERLRVCKAASPHPGCCYASPTVRGDREAIARIIDPTAFAEDASGNWYPESLSRRGSAMARAGSILSFPVQPIAPRLPQDTLDRLAMLKVSEDEVYEVLKKHLPEDMIDGIWQEIKEAGKLQAGAGEREAARILRGWAKAYRDTPEHRFPSDPHAEFFPVDLESAADLLASRQAPHSSRETET